ncbi:hypothetical protein [Actinotalea subterranea]|uniref:hypothetical protein n=1 Tax=Actinotalea subterranea TaxID=2607497 RepID=UPI0011EC8607|nr:hypothetical protein [Actinotalea subterranea]
MAQLTIHHDHLENDVVHHRAHTDLRTPQEKDESRRERLRSVLPALVAVGLLAAVALGGVLMLRDLIDFGVWFLSAP